MEKKTASAMRKYLQWRSSVRNRCLMLGRGSVLGHAQDCSPDHPEFPSRLREDLQRHVEIGIREAGGHAGAQARGVLRHGGEDHGDDEDAALLAAVGELEGGGFIRHPHGDDGRLAG